MRGKRRPEYFFLSAIAAIIGIAGALVLGIVLTDAGSPLGARVNSESSDVILRTTNLVNGDEKRAEEVRFRVGEGMYSIGDYIVSVMTSPEYLVKGVNDQKFSEDLCSVLYGEINPDKVDEVVDELSNHTRMYVINEYAVELNKSYKVSSRLDSKKGSEFSDIVVNTELTNSDGYTIGIKEAKGSIRLNGDDVRTDFFVDNTLYRGYLNMSSEPNSDGVNEFTMAWDTLGVSSGSHEVYIFVRSSDGRGQVVSGGSIVIPHLMNLSKDGVSLGDLYKDRDSSWYLYDAGDSDAYVNFVDISGDIKVSIYDVYGNLVGTNDLPDSKYEVLRAHKQDLDEISKETGIEGVSNAFYVCVERSNNTEEPIEDISYKMVQSPSVAYYQDEYMAVTSDIKNAKDDTEITLRDLNLNVFTTEFGEVEILPLNGYLTNLEITNIDNGENIKFWPNFDNGYLTYAYFMNSDRNIAINAQAQEGYAANMTIKASSQAGDTEYSINQAINIPLGETEVSVLVQSFDGTSKEYKIYLLNQNDDADFSETTLVSFPQSYYSGLWLLHKLHPQYVFQAFNAPMTYDEALNGENNGSRSLSQKSSHPEYIKKNSPVYDKPDWMAVKGEVVSYYLDPRNFLLEDRVFMFEQLSFNADVHTVEGVKAIINGSFMDTNDYDYAQIIYDAGKESGVSPYFLASRILQEMGFNGASKLAYGKVDEYEGYYNYYNIGATATTAEGGAVRNGARYAKWGRDADQETISEAEAAILLPWDSVDKAIKGGAKWIALGYIDAMQDTLYFQKFDIIENGTDFYQHQYAQNIQMAYSESKRYYRSYKSINQLDNKFVFIIPVYSGMPETYGYLPEA